MMPRLHAVTFGSESTPSTRYRFLNGIDRLSEYFCVTWSPDYSDPHVSNLDFGDILFIQKRIPRLGWTWLTAPRIKAAIVYDYDDALWTSPGPPHFWTTRLRTVARLKAIMRRADLVLAANRYLAEWAKQAGVEPLCLPMSVPLPSPAGQPERPAPGPVRFGWGGHPQSHYVLRSAERDLAAFFQGNGEARFVVLSGKRPDLGFEFDWWPYDAAAEARFFAEIDVGVVPSTNSEFDLGKSPIKILQHFANGRPVITNGGGATTELVRESTGWRVGDGDAWRRALQDACANADVRRRKGAAARRLIETEYSNVAAFECLATVLENLSRASLEKRGNSGQSQDWARP